MRDSGGAGAGAAEGPAINRRARDAALAPNPGTNPLPKTAACGILFSAVNGRARWRGRARGPARGGWWHGRTRGSPARPWNALELGRSHQTGAALRAAVLVQKGVKMELITVSCLRMCRS